MTLRSNDFESFASASSAIPAQIVSISRTFLPSCSDSKEAARVGVTRVAPGAETKGRGHACFHLVNAVMCVRRLHRSERVRPGGRARGAATLSSGRLETYARHRGACGRSGFRD